MQNIKSGSKQNSTFYHYIKTTIAKQDYYKAHNNLSKKKLLSFNLQITGESNL